MSAMISPDAPGGVTENTRQYNATVVLQPLATAFSLSIAQRVMEPGHDTTWDIIRVWAYSIGYEPAPQPGFAGFIGSNYDPYNSERGSFSAVLSGVAAIINPCAHFFRNTVAPENLIQRIGYVPRSYDPIALQQATRIQSNERVIVVASELYNTVVTADPQRRGRSVNFGIEVIERITVGA